MFCSQFCGSEIAEGLCQEVCFRSLWPQLGLQDSLPGSFILTFAVLFLHLPPAPCGILSSRASCCGLVFLQHDDLRVVTLLSGSWPPGGRKWKLPERSGLRLELAQLHFCHSLLLKAVTGHDQTFRGTDGEIDPASSWNGAGGALWAGQGPLAERHRRCMI